MTGRQEADMQIDARIQRRLETLPAVFETYYLDMKSDRKSYHTMNQYISRAAEFAEMSFGADIDDMFYKSIEPMHIKRYIANSKGDDDAGAKWFAVKSFCGFLVDNHYIDDDPTQSIKAPKNRTEHPVVYLTPEEIEMVKENVYRDSCIRDTKRNLAIVSLFLTTGIRCSALTQINIEDVDFTQRHIRVVEKGNKLRYIHIGETMCAQLLDWLKDRAYYYPNAESNALFITTTNNRISNSTVAAMIKRHTADLNKHITPHKLRATCATTLGAAGVNIQTIREVLGHTSVQTSMRYVAAVDKEKEKAIDVLDKIVAG